MSEMPSLRESSGEFAAIDVERESKLREIRKEAERDAREREPGANGHRAAELKASSETGYYGMPLLKTPAWTWEIPVYFFVGGAAGVASVIASVARIADGNRELIRDARWLAAIGGAISPALLVGDLGMPSRFLNMLRVFKVQSPMSVGSWTLVAFSSSSAAAAMLAEIEGRRPKMAVPILTDAMQIISALSGLVLATYTGILIGATAIPVWNENISTLPMHFAASGTSAAVSILELRGHRSRALNRIGIGAAAVETFFGASMELRPRPAMQPVRSGWTGWLMRAAGVLSGPLPLALRILAGTSRRRGRREKLRRAAAISSLAGSMATRWAWVYAGRVSAKDPKIPLHLPGPSKPRYEQLSQDK